MTKREMTYFALGGLAALVLFGVTNASAAQRTLFRGAIVMGPAGKACPSGWATVSGLDNRFPMGGTSADTGGASSHAHAVARHSHSMTHTHSIPGHSHSVAAHSHGLNLDTEGAGAWGVQTGIYNEYYVEGTYSEGGSPHTHQISGNTSSGGSGTTGTSSAGTSGAASAGTTSESTGSTDERNHLPPYSTVRFCKSS